VLLESGLDAIGCVDWLKGLILDGIVAGVGAVLGFIASLTPAASVVSVVTLRFSSSSTS